MKKFHFYQHRYPMLAMLYGLITVSMYLYEWQVQWQQVLALREEKAKLQETVDQLHEFAKQPISLLDAGNINIDNALADIVASVRQYALDLLMANNTGQVMTAMGGGHLLHLVIQGNISEILHWLMALSQQSSVIVMTNFSLHEVPKQTLKLDMKLLLPGLFRVMQSQANPMYLLQPVTFCQTPVAFLSDAATHHKQFSFTEMQLIGYLQDRENKIALVKLPDAEIVAVKMGMYIAKENALVTMLQTDKITLQLQHSRAFILRN